MFEYHFIGNPEDRFSPIVAHNSNDFSSISTVINIIALLIHSQLTLLARILFDLINPQILIVLACFSMRKIRNSHVLFQIKKIPVLSIYLNAKELQFRKSSRLDALALLQERNTMMEKIYILLKIIKGPMLSIIILMHFV